MKRVSMVRNVVVSMLVGSCTLQNVYASSTDTDAVSGGMTFSTFSDAAVDAYERTPSARNSNFEFLSSNPDGPFSPVDIFNMPMKARGTPGICLLDYDNDGDLDIYVTNGPGTANSLYHNQLVEDGVIGFLDKALAADVAAVDHDGSGCVFGDIDNDGDHDLYVLGAGEENRLFENLGDGTFTDITASSNSGGGAYWSISASMGDVNNDGLLDIYVGNAFDMNNRLPIALEPIDSNQHNQLFINIGGNQFADASQTSGIHVLEGMRISVDGEVVPIPDAPAGITWAVAMVDFDLDGNIDIFEADDQGAIAPLSFPPGELNLDRGLIHLFKNDGSGEFVDAIQSTTGGWMGLSFADFNRDGHMDYFASNFGDANSSVIIDAVLGLPPEDALGTNASRWFFGTDEGAFIDSVDLGDPAPSVPGMITSAFGWGTVAFDYDNDADTDILYVGGIQGPFIFADNPLAVLTNDGDGNFSRDTMALAEDDGRRHLLGVEEGLAAGDLNNDGFVDVVSAAAFSIPNPVPDEPEVLPNPFGELFGGAFGPEALISPVFAETGVPEQFTFLPAFLDYPNGKLSVEISDANNGNNWIAVNLVGTIGLVTDGSVNRDGIGAVVRFTPKEGSTAMQPIVGGSSYQSQNSLTAHFGLGTGRKGVVDVLWPGGVQNRYLNARAGETVIFPEIPCDPVRALQAGSAESDGEVLRRLTLQEAAFMRCVRMALRELVDANVISSTDTGKFRRGMRSLFRELNEM